VYVHVRPARPPPARPQALYAQVTGSTPPKTPRLCSGAPKKPVLLAPGTYRCRRRMLPLTTLAFSALREAPQEYYMPAYSLTVNEVVAVKLLKTLLIGKDQEVKHTGCTTPLGEQHPECMCFPVAVKQHWEKSFKSPLRPQLVPFTAKQERKYLRLYARAGGSTGVEDDVVGPAAPPAAAGAQPAPVPAPAAKAVAPAKQPCKIGDAVYSTHALHEAFLYVAWGAWLKCEPAAREWRLLSAVSHEDTAGALAVLLDMAAQAPAPDPAPNLQRPRDGRTALHIAAENGMLAIVMKLFDLFYVRPVGLAPGAPLPAGAVLDPTVADVASSSTPLHAAIFHRRADVALYMLHMRDTATTASGLPLAPINAKDAMGNTPLHLAAHAGDAMYRVVHWLVAMDAVLDCRNILGQTATDLAALSGASKVGSFILVFATAERENVQLPDQKISLILEDVEKTESASVAAYGATSLYTRLKARLMRLPYKKDGQATVQAAAAAAAAVPHGGKAPPTAAGGDKGDKPKPSAADRDAGKASATATLGGDHQPAAPMVLPPDSAELGAAASQTRQSEVAKAQDAPHDEPAKNPQDEPGLPANPQEAPHGAASSGQAAGSDQLRFKDHDLLIDKAPAETRGRFHQVFETADEQEEAEEDADGVVDGELRAREADELTPGDVDGARALAGWRDNFAARAIRKLARAGRRSAGGHALAAEAAALDDAYGFE